MYPEIGSVAFVVAAIAYYRGEGVIGTGALLIGLFCVGAFAAV